MTHSSFDDDLSQQLLNQRIVFLGREVDDELAERICAQLLVLSALDSRADITMFINSPGGSVTAGLAIYDTMHLIPNEVSTVATGFAASMGQVLLVGGAPSKRFALANARVMMHQPSAGIGGTAADMAIQAESHEQAKRTIQRINSAHTGQSPDTIERDSDRDRWFTAEQALEYGMVDQIVATLKDIRPNEPARRIGL